VELSCQVHTLVAYSPGGESPVGLEYGRIFRTGEIPNRDSDLAHLKALNLKNNFIITMWFLYLTILTHSLP